MTEQQPFNSEGRQVIWSASSLTSYMKCPRYYYYTYIQGWSSAKKSVHLLFGGWYATAMETFYTQVSAGVEPLVALRETVREALQNTWDVEDEEGEWISDHNTKTRDNLIRSIVWYIDQYYLDPAAEDYPISVLADGTPAVELKFVWELADNIMLRGVLDRVVEADDGQYIMDQKTTGGAISAYYFKQYTNDAQMSTYTITGKVLYNLPVKGIIVDAAQIAVGFTRFGRGFISRSNQQLEEFKDTAIAYIRRAQTDNDYLPNYASCNNYGGCAFRDVCARSPELRDNFLRADFKRIDRQNTVETR